MKRSLSLHTMLLVLSLAQLRPTTAQDSMPAPALFGTDDIGRTLPQASEVREFRKDRHVGIFYFDPEVVFVTGWNEWIAMQLNQGEGRPVFCDQFDAEYSRDVEMMKGGYADNYYLQLAANIRRYKGVLPTPICSKQTTIDSAGPFEQWKQVACENTDHADETRPRDYAGCGNTHYSVTTGRNDFRVLKVAQDANNLYFYAETSEPISPSSDARQHAGAR
ncbi:MAG: hypothetical protein ABI557_05245 [Aureliella sp.]